MTILRDLIRAIQIINRYGPTIEPKSFIADIEKALAEPSKL